MRYSTIQAFLSPRRHVLAALALAGFASLLSPRDATASVSIAASIEELARGSSVIARVTPLESESLWENGRIVTYSRVRVDSVIAGAMENRDRELRVRTLGGRVGSIGQNVEGEAALAPSEPSVVLLAARGASHVVVGRAQGQLLVRRDAHGEEIVRVGAVGGLVERHVRPPMRPVTRRVLELDGAPFAAVAADVKRAWEVGHAR